MTRRFTKILAALALLVFMTPSMVGWGQTRAEEVYKTSLFGSNYNSKGVSSYTGNEWYSTTDGFRLDIVNANNNNNGWNYIKIGGKNGAYTGTLTTNAAIDNPITKVALTIDAITSANVTSMKLYSRNNSSSWAEIGSFSKSTGTQYVTVTTPAANLYYKIEVVCTQGSSNGLVTISKVEYYHNAGGAYTITPVSNNASYGSVSLSGNTITATPNSGYRVIAGNGGYTVTAGTATVTNNGDNTFSVSPESDCTVQINFEAIPTHTATFSVNGVVASSQTVAEGADITFPADPASINEKVFMGWTDAVINGTQSEAPTFVTSATMGNSDVTFYAVFASVIPGTAMTVTDELTRATTGITNGSTTYSNWSGKTLNSNAVYAGNSAGGNNSIQLRTNNSNSGVVTTASGGKAKKVTISWNSNTTNGRVLDIYGKSSAYSAATDLYNANNQGTELGSITYGGTSTEVTITGDYKYIGMRSNDGAMYISSISIEWESISPDTYSDYCTTVEADPSVTVTPSTINALYTGVDEGTIEITYNNLPEEYSFDIVFCDANGDELEGDDPDWIYAAIQEDNVNYIIDANHGEARTAYFKVSASWLVEVGDEFEIESIYSDLVTVNQEAAPEPSITIANATVNVDAAEHEGTLELTYENLPITGMTDFNIQFYNANNEELNEEPDWIVVTVAEQDPEVGEGYVVSYFMLGNEGAEARTAYFKVYAMDDETNLVYSNLVTISQDIVPLFIGADPSTIEVGYQGTDNGGFEVLFDERLQSPYGSSVVLCFYDENDNQINDPEWFQYQYIQDYHSFEYTISENASTEPRTAQMKIKYTDPYTTATIFSDYIPISQDAAPVLDYATLPFEFDSEYSFIANTSGLTESGVGNYSSSYPHLKFDGTGDWLILHFNEAPGMLSFTIKGNNFDGGTFSVQTSEDGATYSDLGTYNYFGTSGNDNYDEEFTNLGQNVRYIKWIYTEKVSGNVALGNIKLFKPITKEIIGGQWYLISSPVGNVTPTAVDNMTEDQTYGLFTFDQEGDAEGREWLNYKAGAFSQLQAGKGYLYINENSCTLTFPGTAYSTPDGSATFPIDYYTSNPTTSFRGLNLVGNPFNEDAAINLPFYKMNATTGEIETASGLVHPMEGVFVVASENVNSVTFQTGIGYGGGDEKFSLNLTQNRGNVIDRAIVRFDEGGQLPKVQLFENSTKIYISQNGKDYAVVRSEGQGELPVNFRASENGTYTLSMDVENMDMNYLHLIDNMTGMDVDLLQTPSYTFEAKVNDYESRFRLVFAANNEDGVSTGSTTFAFYSNGSWIINNAGEATLQVVDLTGRILSSETVNGSVSKTLNAVPGIYMLRLINGDNVNVQKIVVR